MLGRRPEKNLGMADLKPVRFPCESLPEKPASQARLLGIYPQRPEGLFMQRVKAPAGRMTLEQWQGLAGLAARYTPDYPLHVTTRQNLELHGVREEDLPAVQQGIDSLGLTGAAACGDSVRNITVCPRNGCCPGTWDIGDVGPCHPGCRGIVALAGKPAAKVQDQRFRLPRGVRPTLDQRRGTGGQPGRRFPRHLGRVAGCETRPGTACLRLIAARRRIAFGRGRAPVVPCGRRSHQPEPAHGCVICGND